LEAQGEVEIFGYVLLGPDFGSVVSVRAFEVEREIIQTPSSSKITL
jgi:hypothetical protein